MLNGLYQSMHQPQPSTTICNYPQPAITIHNHPQPYKTIHNHPQPSTVTYNHLQLSTTTHNHPQPPKNYSECHNLLQTVILLHLDVNADTEVDFDMKQYICI